MNASLEILFGESRNASFADGIQHVTLRYVSLPSVDDDSVKRVIYFFNALVEILVSVPFSPLRRSRRGAEQRLLGSPVSLRLRPLVFARRRLGGGQLFPTRREFLVDVDVIVVHSRALVRRDPHLAPAQCAVHHPAPLLPALRQAAVYGLGVLALTATDKIGGSVRNIVMHLQATLSRADAARNAPSLSRSFSCSPAQDDLPRHHRSSLMKPPSIHERICAELKGPCCARSGVESS